jgi:hypothetical protein
MSDTENVPQGLNARDWGRYYNQRGWTIVPIPPKDGKPGKGPCLKDWQRRTVADGAEDVNPAAGVGILLGRPSGNLVCVDLDCPEAVLLADAFLPPTWMVRSRPGARRSHRYYVVDGELPPTRKYENPAAADGERATLVELLSTGRQAVAPPSLHPSGERAFWEGGTVDPARVDAAKLADLVAIVAAGALLARQWPPEGRRHDAALALAGGLARAGWRRP